MNTCPALVEDERLALSVPHVLVLILILVVLSIVRVFPRPKRVDLSLVVHNEFHTGPTAPHYPEFCERFAMSLAVTRRSDARYAFQVKWWVLC